MNYAEELAYWYLRLNGFFPITNFVIHRSNQHEPSDCDVLAVRPPHVFEVVGGNPDDLDNVLFQRIDTSRTVGIVCEVKAGEYASGEILRENHVIYAVRRLGFVDDVTPFATALTSEPVVNLGDSHQVLKLLITNRLPRGSRPYYVLTLSHVRHFIKERMRRYHQKQSDWVFFNSNIIQEIIWEIQQERGPGR